MLRLLLLLLLTLAPSAALAGPGTLAVLYFDNQGNPELEPLKVGLAQMLITDLQGTDGLTVVERQQLQAILDELELGHSGVADKDTAARVGKLLGAEWILMGGYFELAGTLRIDARLVRVETGEILHAHGENGTTPEFLALQDALAEAFKTDLAARATAAPDATAPDAAAPGDGARAPRRKRGDATEVPPRESEQATALARHDADTVKAAVAYSEGLIFLDKAETARAREAFEKAVAADPALEAAKAELAALEL